MSSLSSVVSFCSLGATNSSNWSSILSSDALAGRPSINMVKESNSHDFPNPSRCLRLGTAYTCFSWTPQRPFPIFMRTFAVVVLSAPETILLAKQEALLVRTASKYRRCSGVASLLSSFMAASISFFVKS